MLTPEAFGKTPYLQQTGGFWDRERDISLYPTTLNEKKKSYTCICIYRGVHIYPILYFNANRYSGITQRTKKTHTANKCTANYGGSVEWGTPRGT